jgi:hypothetical protein
MPLKAFGHSIRAMIRACSIRPSPNMMTDDEILEVVAAHKEGKKIQVQSITDRNLWYDEPAPTWNFANHNYRVAPEPRKPREWWLIEPSIPKTYVYGEVLE